MAERRTGRRRFFRVVLGGGMIMAMVASTGDALAEYQGPKRIDFDERLIKGQTAKAGAVYIFDRQKLGEQRLVNRKRTFRLRTIRKVFPHAKE